MSKTIYNRCHGRFTASQVCDKSMPPTKRMRLAQHFNTSVTRRSHDSRSQASMASNLHVTPPKANSSAFAKRPVGHVARQKEADREFYTDLLSSAATKRDAKAYITRLKEPSTPNVLTAPAASSVLKSRVNLGNLFGRAIALDTSPVFTQHNVEDRGFEEPELHVALVKLSGADKLPDNLLRGIAQTLSQLMRLGTAPCVVLEMEQPTGVDDRHRIAAQAERLAKAIDSMTETGSRIIDNLFNISDSGAPEVSLAKLLLRQLRREHIPIVLPWAYSDSKQRIVPITANAAFLALAREFSEPSEAAAAPTGSKGANRNPRTRQKRICLDRVIVLDHSGGIPSPRASDGRHVFVNLEQEFNVLERQLSKSECNAAPQHLSNLVLLRDALNILPLSSSGLMTTPAEASNSSQIEPSSPQMVGTRRQRNMLIHNLLTDRPAFSSSLPKTRLSKKSQTASAGFDSTFIKKGMPLKIFPDPFAQPWTTTSPRMRLTDSNIDLDRLVHLIDDSFSRKLDIKDYLDRVNDKMAGVIIAGDYEGGAILTWETPPGVSGNDSHDPSITTRLVPYLDKFAVLKKSQGAGGVADIVFNAMVRSCFPTGVCWRSRKDNLVNKWYFERSSGTWKIPDTNWTMFWTTTGANMNEQKFTDYESVCRTVEPSWADKKKPAD